MLRIFSLILFLSPALALAQAQTYPDFKSVYVNDLAAIIDADTETRLQTRLKALFDDHGVEATVLTIGSRKIYGNNASIERFATGLFNHWGIGGAKRNDGILILIVRDDREMRIELGAGYGPKFDDAAANTIDQYFLPAFRNGDYPAGIEKGTFEVIRRIALPHAKGQTAPATALKGKSEDWFLIIAFGAGFALLFARSLFSNIALRFRACPNCGRKGLRRSNTVIKTATRTIPGRGESHTTCKYCDYSKTGNYRISRLSSATSRVRFGGGRSSGGGASGRW